MEHVRSYVAERVEPVSPAPLLEAVPQVQALRRLAVALKDRALIAQLAETDPADAGRIERVLQTLGALERELNAALGGLQQALAAVAQLARVERELAAVVANNPTG
jgi:hypothetical protein